MNILLNTAFCISLLWNSAGIHAQVAVIAHKTVPVDSLDNRQLLDYYTGEIQLWQTDEPVVVFDLKNQDKLKESFYEFLGKSISRMKSIWMKRLLSGEGDPPESLKNEEEMLEKIAETPGAIGFVNPSRVDPRVKILALISDNP